MPFIAECLFCKRKVRAPDRAVGKSIACARCGSQFTLVPMTGEPAVAGSGLHRADDRPAIEVPPPPPAPDEVRAAAGPRRLSPFPVAALFAGSLALLFASLPSLDLLTWPCAGLGLLLGLAGAVRARASGGALALSLAGAGVSTAVLLVAGLWPGVFNPLKAGRAGAADAENKQPRAVHVGKAAARRDSDPVGEGAWTDASQDAVQLGDLRVRVLSAAVRLVPFKDPARARAARERPLLIALRIYNLGAERRIAYETWGEPSAGRENDLARLSDNTGRTYRLKPVAAGVEVTGRSPRASLAPGKYVDDLLIFEPPPSNVAYLRLELPASACGGADTFRLQLPASMVQSR